MDLFTLGLLQKNLSGNKGDIKSKNGESSYTITDAANFPVLGLNLYGKSVQDGTPTPDAPVDIVSVGDGGSVDIKSCGKNLFPWNDYTKAPIGDWGLSSGCTYKVTSSEIQMEVAPNTAGTGGGVFIWQADFKDLTSPYYGNTFTISYELRADSEITVRHGFEIEGMYVDSVVGTEWKRFSCSATIKNPCNIGWKTINQPETILYIRKIQIEIGDTATEYEPYKGSTSTITSALPLCGIPVESGGNYTDKNGQQWVCDELIYNADGTGKIIKRTSTIMLDGSDDESYQLGSVTDIYAPFSILNAVLPVAYTIQIKSNVTDKVNVAQVTADSFAIHCGNNLNILFGINMGVTTIEGARAWLSSHPTTIIYPLAEPQEIPLSAAEMIALRQLMTYSGTTNISNSDNADMDVKYCINQVMADYYPIFAGQGADVQPLVLFEGTDEGYTLADGFTGFSQYSQGGADIAITKRIDTTTESQYGYRIAKSWSIDGENANYTDSVIISSNELVDLTNHNTICIDFYGYCDYDKTSSDLMGAYFKIDKPDTLPQSKVSYDWTGWDNMCMYYRKYGKYYFDVSHLTGKHYLYFGIFHGTYDIGFTNGIKIYKMTLI